MRYVFTPCLAGILFQPLMFQYVKERNNDF
nr:MAG TPA: hypothetical protein [Caudoviricetes sp.]